MGDTIATTRLYKCRDCEVYGADSKCWCCGKSQQEALDPEEHPLRPTGDLSD